MARKSHCKLGTNRLRAMTLLELLIVLAIVSVLVAVSYPSYQSQMIKAARSLAKTDMSRLQLYLESNYNGSYSEAKEALMPAGECSLCQSKPSDYLFSIEASIDSYTIYAQPVGKQTQDDCLASISDRLSLDQTGLGNPSACW
ncbi:type IV pilin protein [Vibrio rhodolitus]|uniref:type IV pilin protein n=1 Tax=Vibrio rhodolitus TaxID=2231649 RepID=UPI000E0B8904|nr:type IV pilin protein [Vibrio rhodolitus]